MIMGMSMTVVTTGVILIHMLLVGYLTPIAFLLEHIVALSLTISNQWDQAIVILEAERQVFLSDMMWHSVEVLVLENQLLLENCKHEALFLQQKLNSQRLEGKFYFEYHYKDKQN